MKKTLRLILGDQLNNNHSWFNSVDDSVTYVMMEIRSETDYVQLCSILIALLITIVLLQMCIL